MKLEPLFAPLLLALFKYTEPLQHIQLLPADVARFLPMNPSEHKGACMLGAVADRLPVSATLVNNRVMVWDLEESKLLFDAGFYGKPLGVKKTKQGEVEKPIELSIFETAYLLQHSALKLFHGSEELDATQYIEMMEPLHTHFEGKLRVFTELRNRGFVVRPGLKFGEAFSVYRKGPGMDHAPYLVHIASFDSKLDAIELVRAGRLSHSVKKTYVIALLKGEEVKFFGFERFKP